MVSKNMLFPLLALATIMSFSTGYANDSLKDALKKHVLNKKVATDVAIGLSCGAAGPVVGCIGTAYEIKYGKELFNDRKASKAITTLLLAAPQAYNGSLTKLAKELKNQPLEIVNSDNLNLKSAVTQAIFAIIGYYSMDKGIDVLGGKL